MVQTHARIGQTLDQCIQKLSKQQQKIEEQRSANVIHLQTTKRHTAQIG